MEEKKVVFSSIKIAHADNFQNFGIKTCNFTITRCKMATIFELLVYVIFEIDKKVSCQVRVKINNRKLGCTNVYTSEKGPDKTVFSPLYSPSIFCRNFSIQLLDLVKMVVSLKYLIFIHQFEIILSCFSFYFHVLNYFTTQCDIGKW